MIEDIQDSAPSEVYRQYKWFHTKAELEVLPGWHWCISEGCKSGQQIARRTSKFNCVHCKQVHCVEHNVPWHKGETCKQYEHRKRRKAHRKEEEASKKYIKEKAKRCPGCKRPVEKINGCDHMTCTKCRHEFCWKCLASYKVPGRVYSVTHRAKCPHWFVPPADRRNAEWNWEDDMQDQWLDFL
ncbi:hypothetical protein E8E11_007248 [Didymella keratinophila]|nr:hypothetical protein E8E11_007248 [Didymella keratinophila]